MNLAIFASGTGTNAANITRYFLNHPQIRVALIVCNNPRAKVLEFAEHNHVPTLMVDKQRFFNGDGYLEKLKEHKIDFIILAGFLWKIPQSLLNAYPNRIINIHPALLPKYGGKGMFGAHVHQAVLDNQEKESGITIHYVDEHYDNGDIIFQAKCVVNKNDNAESLALKVHALEQQYFPQVIEKVINAGL